MGDIDRTEVRTGLRRIDPERERRRICRSCAYWRPGEPGQCRRLPPVVDNGKTVFPETQELDWCGLWRALRQTAV